MSGKAIKYMKRVKMSGVKVMRLVIEAKIFVYLLFTLNYMNSSPIMEIYLHGPMLVNMKEWSMYR